MILQQTKQRGSIFYDQPEVQEGDLPHKGDMLAVYLIVLVVFHLFKYMLVFIFSSSRNKEQLIEDQLKKQAEMELNYENHFTQYLLEAHYKQRTDSAKQKATKLLRQRTEKKMMELKQKMGAESQPQGCCDSKQVMLNFFYPLMQIMTLILPAVGLYIATQPEVSFKYYEMFRFWILIDSILTLNTQPMQWIYQKLRVINQLKIFNYAIFQLQQEQAKITEQLVKEGKEEQIDFRDKMRNILEKTIKQNTVIKKKDVLFESEASMQEVEKRSVVQQSVGPSKYSSESRLNSEECSEFTKMEKA